MNGQHNKKEGILFRHLFFTRVKRSYHEREKISSHS